MQSAGTQPNASPPLARSIAVPESRIQGIVKGRRAITADTDLRRRFRRDGKEPRTVIVIRIAEVYSQCARALIRSALWTSGDQSEGLPTVGEMLRCAWHQWQFDIRTGKSWFDPRRTKVRAFPAEVHSGAELKEGPYQAETFPVRVEESYIVVEA